MALPDHPSPDSLTLKRIRGAKAFKTGLKSENKVCSFFQKKGYVVLAKRLRTPFGEIDLVVSNNDWLIGVEVKSRKTHYESAFSLTPKQSKRLLEAFDYLLSQHPEWGKTNTRFDAALVDETGEIEIIKDALRFY